MAMADPLTLEPGHLHTIEWYLHKIQDLSLEDGEKFRYSPERVHIKKNICASPIIFTTFS